ncbi:MAG TPA: carbohydrate kinase [Luteimonas sp.]|nr:carbohydrate kinase [Luteimonas sp.]
MTQVPAIACFGEALIDFLALPAQPGEDGRRFLEQAGGAPANVAVGIARLGGHARFAGMLSEDMFGDFLLAQFARFGVDTHQVRRTGAARTALAFVSLREDGERSFNFYRPPAADLLFGPGDFGADAFAGLAAFHVCSNSLSGAPSREATLHGMQLAADAGALVSMDLNLRPALWPRDVDPTPTLWRALELAQLVKLSGEELAFLARDGAEQDVVARLLSHATRAVLVTDGAAPIRWFTRAGHGTAPTFAVDAIDTTAAGDAFVAGLLQRLVERGVDATGLAAAFDDAPLRTDLLRHAAATGALATTRRGAFAAMPDRAGVQALLETVP